MKKIKLHRSTLSLLLVALLLTSSLTALADDIMSTCTVRVEGVSESYFYGPVSFADNADAPASALYVLEQALAGQDVPYELKDGYIATIGTDTAGAFGGLDGWVYYINGQEAAVGMADYIMQPGDSLLVCYADPYGEEPTLMPQVATADSGDSVRFVFSALYTTYDEDWNPTVTTVPITEATATIDGIEYVTDSSGHATVPRSALAGGAAAVQVEKYSASGKPLVVRLPADYTVAVPVALSFTDISATAWYREYVLELVALGAIDGYGDGTFRPTREVTRAEFIKLLACTAPQFDAAAIQYQAIYNDVQADDWFAPYITWAAQQGVIDHAASFNPNVNLTRQDMALMAYRFAVLVLGKTLPADQAAPAFVDEAHIAQHCREAVYLLQKAGVIEGVQSADGFAFEPTANTVRSQVSKVIVKLLAIE